MFKFVPVFLSLILLCSCDNSTQAEKSASLQNDKIYFFYYNECPYCHHALDYINKKYPGLKLAMVNIHNDGGYKLFAECGAKFKLGRNIGTPLFCMGNNYLMGWSPASEQTFDQYVKPFL